MSPRALALAFAPFCALAACGGAPDGASADDAPAADAPPRDAAAVEVADVAVVPPDATLDDVELDDAGGPAPDAAAPADAPVADVRPASDAEPVSAPALRWTWVDVPGSACANGRPTGFGVNPREGSEDVLIFLQGGGACWDGPSCWGPVSTSFFVATGYGRLQFGTDILRPASLFLRRDDAANPFRDFNMVYVPYCTGDVHAGNRVATYEWFGRRETHHVGARNLGLFLARVAATFPRARRVFLAGDSAGGFGVAFSLPRVQAAFPDVRVAVVDDSGPPIQPAGDRWSTWSRTWGVEFPEGCTAACAQTVDAVTEVYRRRYADNPIAVLSFEHDIIIRTFMGHDAPGFRSRLVTLADLADRSWPSAKYFITAGMSHVLEIQPVRPRGFDLWVQRFVLGDPTLRSVRP